LSYEVSRCTDDATDYVLLINDSYIAHLISYSDGVNQYCGTVVGLGSGTPPLTFINDYGLLVKPLSCETCLATENQKVLIQSCTDSGIQEIVWASALYGSEEVSNLSTDDGCFEVIGLTGDPVTINSFLNFDPQPGCEPCIECNGVLYEVSDCDNTVTETVKLYQYLPLDTVFFNPYNNTCYYVNSITTGPESYELYSVETFGLVSSSGCLNCTSTSDVVIWTASICLNNPAIQYNLSVTTDSTAQAGDIVKLMWGSNEWICVELLEIELPGNGGSYYNTVKDGSGTTMIYNGCEDCNSQGLIGVTLVSCGTPQTEQYVSITLDNYLQILNYGSLTNYSVSAINGNCFTITNVCPIPLTVEGFTPVAFYFNCFICSTENQNRVRVAGTEYFECVICCDCGATGSTVTQVTPPHPVWTDGYGNAVTQLNMVSLGGMFGLNN
jgi:hypothetical protein